MSNGELALLSLGLFILAGILFCIGLTRAILKDEPAYRAKLAQRRKRHGTNSFGPCGPTKADLANLPPGAGPL